MPWPRRVAGGMLTRWREHPGLGRAYALVVANTVGNGALMLGGGAERTSARAFATMRTLGGWSVWGCVLLAAGLLLALLAATGRPRLARLGLIVVAVVDGLLALWFFTAANGDPMASYLGASNFLTLCCWACSQQDEYRPGAL